MSVDCLKLGYKRATACLILGVVALVGSLGGGGCLPVSFEMTQPILHHNVPLMLHQPRKADNRLLFSGTTPRSLVTQQ